MGFLTKYWPSKMVKNKNAGKPRNYALEGGVYRFGRSKMYHKKAAYKFLKKKTAKKAAPKKPMFVEKQIGGAKNGGTRMVRVKKAVNDYPTVDPAPKGTSKNFFSKHKRSLRPSLATSAVAILLAGVHKGKRVIVLKQLETGLLLVTGPMKCNGCPLRRVNQIYLLATSTKVDVSGVKIPANINDEYFRRAPKRLTIRRVIFSNQRKKNISLLSSEKLINKLLISKFWTPLRNILTEKCSEHTYDTHLV